MNLYSCDQLLGWQMVISFEIWKIKLFYFIFFTIDGDETNDVFHGFRE